MAQPAEPKAAASAADTPAPAGERRVQAAEIERDTATTGGRAARGGAREPVAAAGAEAQDTVATVAQQVQQDTDTIAEAAQRSSNAFFDGQRQWLQQVTERYGQVAQRMQQAFHDAAADLRGFMPTPGTAGNYREVQESIAGLMNGVMQSQFQATQRLFRLVDPSAAFEHQRQAMRDYVDTLLEGTGAVIRVARQTTEQALRPLETQIEERRQQHRQTGTAAHGGDHVKVSDVMNADVHAVAPEDTVQQATRLMRDEETAVLPVGEGDRLVGVVTDRDLAFLLISDGKDPARTKIRDVMTNEITPVFDDEDLQQATESMAEQQMRQMPVVTRNKRIVGMLSLDDMPRSGRSGRPRQSGKTETREVRH